MRPRYLFAVRVVAVVTLVAIAAGGGVAAGTTLPSTDQFDADQVAAAAQERAAFGLEADYATVAGLLRSPEDVGTLRWGIAMTAAEEALIDLPARLAFEADVGDRLIPYVESLPGFAGSYIDQAHGGGLVVLSTTALSSDQLQPYLPASSRGLSVRLVAHAYQELADAVAIVAETWKLDDVPIRYVGIDTLENGIDVGVAPRDLDRAKDAARHFSASFDVPVSVRSVELPQLEVCTSRDNCHSPMKTGIRVRKGSGSSTYICTQGFHVRKSGDEQWLMAGHCAIGGSVDWYHTGYGLVGETSQLWTLYYSNGIDVTRVDFNDDTQISDDIYADRTDIAGSGNPVLNETVCYSLGYTNAIDCGTVTDDYISYSDGSGRTNLDGALGCCFAAASGDSGSPLYKPVGPNEVAYAKGTHIGTWNPPSSTKLFTRIVEVLTRMGLTLVT